MNPAQKPSRAFLVVISLLLVLGGGLAVLAYRDARQFHLDRELVNAFSRSDVEGAVSQLNAGADPNTTDTTEEGGPLTRRIISMFTPWKPSPKTSERPLPALLLALGMRRTLRGELIPLSNEPIDLINTLLARGASTQVRDEVGDTPLHYAADAGYVECARAFITRHADINAQDDNRDTPLHKAYFKREMLQLLLDNGAEINRKNKHGDTVLALVAGHVTGNPCVPTIRLLLKHGADVNASDVHGATILHNAVDMQNVAAVRELIASGAKVNQKDAVGHTPLSDARRRTRLNSEVLRAQGVAGATPPTTQVVAMTASVSPTQQIIAILKAAGAKD